ncbi:MAG: phosphoglucosamine mutase [Planctomycetaceae bacterium]|nr:phosphoglucosamine mutase [Planctomycetaceae bacterium]
MSSTIPDPAPLMLSVSGARGIVGKTMTPVVAATFAGAFGSHIRTLVQGRRPKLVVARDGRFGGESLARAVQGALASTGCDVVDLGVAMTPTVGLMIRALGADGGMAVTASHNPIEWNGLKCLDGDGLAPPKPVAEAIIARFKGADIAFAKPLDIGSIATDTSANERHVARVVEVLGGAAGAAARIRAKRLHVVLDSVNASGCVGGRMMLDALGCGVTHIYGEPTGIFGHTPEPTAENLGDLAAKVRAAREAGAAVACGFAQDPDADRLAIVDENGRYIGEEYTLVLAALRMLELRGPFALAANLSTSRMIDDVAARFPGAKVLRTAVGEANVVAALKPAGGLLGGEGNGGVIFPEVCWVRDSLSAMALVLDLIASRDEPLSRIVDALPRYSILKSKMDLAAIGGLPAVAGALTKMKAVFANERVNDADGVRVDFADGWVHLRASNTEPIARVIAEAPTKERAQELVAMCAKAAGL